MVSNTPSRKEKSSSSEQSTQRELLSSEPSPSSSDRNVGAAKTVADGNEVIGDVVVAKER